MLQGKIKKAQRGIVNPGPLLDLWCSGKLPLDDFLAGTRMQCENEPCTHLGQVPPGLCVQSHTLLTELDYIMPTVLYLASSIQQ